MLATLAIYLVFSSYASTFIAGFAMGVSLQTWRSQRREHERQR